MSLFEKYGGFATISKVVNELYDALEVNEITAPYFENSDIRALMDHQVKFLSQVLGGPQQYTGKAMSAAHTGMKISEQAFLEVASTVKDVLEDNGVEDDDVAIIIDMLASLKEDIIDG